MDYTEAVHKSCHISFLYPLSFKVLTNWVGLPFNCEASTCHCGPWGIFSWWLQCLLEKRSTPSIEENPTRAHTRLKGPRDCPIHMGMEVKMHDVVKGPGNDDWSLSLNGCLQYLNYSLSWLMPTKPSQAFSLDRHSTHDGRWGAALVKWVSWVDYITRAIGGRR